MANPLGNKPGGGGHGICLGWRNSGEKEEGGSVAIRITIEAIGGKRRGALSLLTKCCKKELFKLLLFFGSDRKLFGTGSWEEQKPRV